MAGAEGLAEAEAAADGVDSSPPCFLRGTPPQGGVPLLSHLSSHHIATISSATIILHEQLNGAPEHDFCHPWPRRLRLSTLFLAARCPHRASDGILPFTPAGCLVRKRQNQQDIIGVVR